MWLVVGLGNPGRQYAGNRHNAGFMVLDTLIRQAGASPPRQRMGAEIAEGGLGRTKVIFCKPMEFMNASGFAVSRAGAFWKIPLSQTVVVHDDMDIEFGRLKLAEAGGTGGHNGLRSIVAESGSEDFCRVRFGIGRPPPAWDGADYVLADFSQEERRALPDLLEVAASATRAVVEDGVVAAMNRFNRRKQQDETGGAT
ncbi:MAG: aminoacyl-tRNA hydrolase [Deltaproteobacteria bacterium]|jgi:PTH1 family peptidyl-tRNA hydrolase|nr:aminoacyl-tRNA hydrolase [Deltaproteobacteria bacterium]